MSRLGVAAAFVDGAFVSGDVDVVDGRVAAVGLAPAGTGIAVPGFVDLQVNGVGDVDFLRADAEAHRRAREALRETGVTTYLPTLVTSPEADVLAALHEVPGDLPGAHLEGPFISPRRLGTHDPSARRDPDSALLERLLAAGRVRMVTLAPELPGAGALVDLLVAHGVVVSLGHTDATAAEAGAAFDRGARAVTHVFNAMRPLHHRDPGVIGAALARDDVLVMTIADGVHLAPETVRLVWNAARERTVLVSDAVAATLGTLDLDVRDGTVRGRGGVLAGGASTMLDALRNLHALGVPLEAAIVAATSAPARLLGDAELGRIAPGCRADVVVLDDRLELVRVV